MRPTSCRAPTAAIARPCSTRSRAARGTSTPTPTRRRSGLKRVTAWCGVVAAGLLVQGGVSRVARGEAGLARALAAAQFDDGGLVSRSPFEQVRLVDRFGLLRACYLRRQAGHSRRHRGRRGGVAGRASWRHSGRRRAVELAGLRPGRGVAPDRSDRRLRASRPAAAPGARLGLSADVGARHDRRARRGAAAAAEDGRAGLGLDPGVRNVRRRPAADRQLRRPGTASDRASAELVHGLRTTAAHSTLVLADTNSTNILPDGSLGKGVEDVAIDRSEDNDASRLEASHDGYVRALRPDPQAQPDARQ